jgi:flagellar basal body-associated protein FliL
MSQKKRWVYLRKVSIMAEETKPTSPGDSVEGIEAVDGTLNQDEAQDAKGVEEKGTGTAEDKAEGEVSAKEEAKTEEDVSEAKPDNKEEKGEEVVEEKAEEKTVAESPTEEKTPDQGKPIEKEAAAEESKEPEAKEIVEEKGKGKEETEEGEVKESDTDKAKGEETPAEGKAEGEVPAKEEAKTEESVSEAKPEDKEGKAEEKAEEGSPADEETADKGEPVEKEAAVEKGSEPEAKEVSEEKSKGEEETIIVEGEKTEAEVTAKKGEGKGAEEEAGEGVAQEVEEAVAEGEEEAGLVSSEELKDGIDDGVTDEEWITWKKEFLNKFQKRFDRKWIISGTAVFLLLAGLIGFLVIPNLHFTDTGEVSSLEEIAGPVYDMRFFLPLAVGSEKTRFVKVTVAIELMDRGFKKEIDEKVSELRKEVIDLVLSKSPREVKSARGKEVLRKEITTRLNIYLSKNCIKNTYFTEIVVL